jgi:hypothetical protein
MPVIKTRRGLKANLPAEAGEGEILVAVDTREMYLGQGTGQAVLALIEREKIDAYDPGSFYPGTPMAGDIVLAASPAPGRVVLIKKASPGLARCLRRPGATTALVIKKNGLQVGALTFTTLSDFGTISLDADTTLTSADLLTIEAPATPDTTISGILVTLKGHMA